MSDGPDNPLSSSEATDQDELRLDPLERGAEPPERWAEANHHGMTPREQREGESLEQRLAQERPDTAERDIHDAGVLGDDEILQGQIEELGPLTEPPIDEADNAGGSVAESLREPDEQ